VPAFGETNRGRWPLFQGNQLTSFVQRNVVDVGNLNFFFAVLNCDKLSEISNHRIVEFPHRPRGGIHDEESNQAAE